MEDFAALLIQEQSNSNVGIIQLLATPFTHEDIVIFVEGPDDPIFYHDFIAHYHPDRELIFIECGGKPGVISANASLSNYHLAVPPFKILFLCDSDFDIVNSTPHSASIFKTDNYSIESYFGNSSYIKYLLSKHCTKEADASTRRQIVAFVDNKLGESVSALLLPMAMCCVARRLGSNFDFDAISINDLVEFQSDGCIGSSGKRTAALESLFSDEDVGCKASSVRSVARIMRGQPIQVWVRGKLVLQLIKFIVLRANQEFKEKLNGSISKISQYLGSSAFLHGKGFLGDIASLSAYVTAAGSRPAM